MSTSASSFPPATEIWGPWIEVFSWPKERQKDSLLRLFEVLRAYAPLVEPKESHKSFWEGLQTAGVGSKWIELWSREISDSLDVFVRQWRLFANPNDRDETVDRYDELAGSSVLMLSHCAFLPSFVEALSAPVALNPSEALRQLLAFLDDLHTTSGKLLTALEPELINARHDAVTVAGYRDATACRAARRLASALLGKAAFAYAPMSDLGGKFRFDDSTLFSLRFSAIKAAVNSYQLDQDTAMSLFEQATQECAIAKQRANIRSTPPPLADGPSPPNLFVWRGKTTELQTKPWKLVSYLWKLPGWRDDEDNVIEAVWGEDVGPRALPSARTSANAAFERKAIPLTVECKNGFVQIQEHPETK